MVKTLLLSLGLLSSAATTSWAQAATPARALVREGVALYDEGQYDQAVAKYKQALAAEPGNQTAQAELAMTYSALNRHDEAIALCRQLLQDHPDADPMVYVTYGNSLDSTHKTAEALEVYKKALQRYPTAFILHFNQGVTLAQQGSNNEAVTSFQRAVALNPAHASSHMLLGTMQLQASKRVPGLLALARFLVLEPTGPRAAARRDLLDGAMMKGVSQANEHNITVNVSSESLKKGKGKKASADDFGPEEMFLSLAGAMSLDAKNKDKSPLEKFIDQFGSLCRVMGERSGERLHAHLLRALLCGPRKERLRAGVRLPGAQLADECPRGAAVASCPSYRSAGFSGVVEKLRVAQGHALATRWLPTTPPIQKAILPR